MQHNETKNERREQIIEGAFWALKEQGLPNLSYDAIAESAGVSRQLVRYHFSNSEDLMISVCDYLAALYREALIAATVNAADGPRLDVFFDFYFDLLEGFPKPRDDQVYDAMMSLAARSKPVRSALRGQYQLLGEVLSHEIELQYPTLTRKSALEISYLFVCLMYGHWKMVATLGLSEDHKFVTRAALDRLILSYLEKGASSETTASVWSSVKET
ncbi:hypothetical protein RA27_22850 [Ruegeria sp. ANG-R]|uniref:TetR/AcrR family transcriptional regulator n=1 Tax=Ruegeria sp. ANG-R TaxID=1577903 RepID=UPI00057FC736|nr:TetR/AcrR family transcriptional regulator [Ruegeria sp. ANG-R]KIC35394.1 hypothetical protein RA27_22850 [Ruegeria sp. ANG-R]